MFRKLRLTAIASFFIASAMAQTAIKVTVLEAGSKEPIPFAGVSVIAGGAIVASGQTNFDGELVLKPVPAGKCNVKVSSLGFVPIEMTGVVIADGQTKQVQATLEKTVIEKPAVTILEYKEPLIKPEPQRGNVITKEEFRQMATNKDNLNNVAATSARVTQRDEGKGINIGGSREDANVVIIDGVRTIGSTKLPPSAIEQVSVITGGAPANIGDATGGVISITTRGPQSIYTYGVEAITSQLTDKFGYNSLILDAAGPIIMKKDSATGNKTSVLGFSLQAQFLTEKDPSPSAIGTYKVKDSVLTYLTANPLRKSPNSEGTKRNAEYITKNDLEPIQARQNVRTNTATLNGKLSYAPTKNLNLVFGGSYTYNKRHDYVYQYALFNPVNNPQSIDNTWRVYGRLTQKFGSSGNETEKGKSSSTISNAFYTLNVSYANEHNIQQDDNHKTNFFDYGYYGKFKTYKTKQYEFGNDKVTGLQNIFVQSNYQDTLVSFQPNTELNPEAAAYTTQYYNIVGDRGDLLYDDAHNPNVTGNYDRLDNVFNGGGLRNGDRPVDIYGMWYNTGRQYGGYTVDDTRQLNISTSFSADVKRHAILVGFEYDQRKSSSWQILPIGLWTRMRQLANIHIQELDKEHPIMVYDANGVFQDTINYDRLYNADEEKQFSRSLRAQEGFGQLEWIDIDNMDRSKFSLDLFSADDLLSNDNNRLVFYNGYDYKGNRLKGNPSLDDFFTKKDENGNFLREVPAFQPIYMAGYIQDAFDFNDLKFRVGLRVDRFDANQRTLKDKYVLYETKKAGEVTEIGGKAVTHPAGIGNDYVVYVNDLTDPTAIVGYRNNDTWYNAEGIEEADPEKIAKLTSTGKITPYLTEPEVTIKSEDFTPSKSFSDYKPSINLMPRIAFTFPISDVANFFAHYDVLTQRPDFVRFDPFNYYFMENLNGAIITNPDLRPSRTTEYELGFEQVLNEAKNSVISLSAYYRQLKDMSQVSLVNYAYPITYKTITNVDFGTVKGITTSYELRRTYNVQLNLSYTLQFADGTGSGATSGANLANAGVPNLRIPKPLDFDQRHKIVAIVDYRFVNIDELSGIRKKIFAYAGANLSFTAGSGFPYSRQSVPDNFGRSNLVGSINGSNLPWTYRMDLKVDKTLPVKLGRKSNEERKTGNLNVYVQVLNLLNTVNVQAVYRYTGSPSDDAYLIDPKAQPTIVAQTDPQAYKDMYEINHNNPGNYSLPRRIRLGLLFSF